MLSYIEKAPDGGSNIFGGHLDLEFKSFQVTRGARFFERIVLFLDFQLVKLNTKLSESTGENGYMGY